MTGGRERKKQLLRLLRPPIEKEGRMGTDGREGGGDEEKRSAMPQGREKLRLTDTRVVSSVLRSVSDIPPKGPRDYLARSSRNPCDKALLSSANIVALQLNFLQDEQCSRGPSARAGVAMSRVNETS